MSQEKYNTIIAHYEKCYALYGDTPKGVDWPKPEDVDVRYRIMSEVISWSNENKGKHSVLDFGCGAGHFVDYLVRTNQLNDLLYSGLDISDLFITLCKRKYPSQNFFCKDILKDDLDSKYDFIIMNGVFTEKCDLTFDEMLEYFFCTLKRIFGYANCGLAFNVMSKQVDWEREDLFHLPMDTLAKFVTKELSRNFIIRNDYGLFEYTTYIYK